MLAMRPNLSALRARPQLEELEDRALPSLVGLVFPTLTQVITEAVQQMSTNANNLRAGFVQLQTVANSSATATPSSTSQQLYAQTAYDYGQVVALNSQVQAQIAAF